MTNAVYAYSSPFICIRESNSNPQLNATIIRKNKNVEKRALVYYKKV